MTLKEAEQLIKNAGIPVDKPQQWADLGCGSGIFSYALTTLLPAGSNITCLDKTLQHIKPAVNEVSLHFQQSDFEDHSFPLKSLSGILMANAIHYVEDKVAFIKRMKTYLQPNGQWIIIEYDTSRSNKWVPFPLSFVNLQKLFTEMGYTAIRRIGEHPSVYSNDPIYACVIS